MVRSQKDGLFFEPDFVRWTDIVSDVVFIALEGCLKVQGSPTLNLHPCHLMVRVVEGLEKRLDYFRILLFWSIVDSLLSNDLFDGS